MLNLDLMALGKEKSGGGGNVGIYVMERRCGHLNWVFMAKSTKLRNPNIRLCIG